MSIDQETTQISPPGKGWYIFTTIVALVALGISGFLLWVSLTNQTSVPGCGSGGALDCEHVLTSRWAQWLNVPVSALAAANYTLALVCLAFTARPGNPAQYRMMWSILVIQAIAGLGAAAWFVALQFMQLDAICIWCMSAHACGALFALSILFRAPWAAEPTEKEAPPVVLPGQISSGRLVVLTLVSLAFLTTLVGGQMLYVPPEHQVTTLGGGGDFDDGKGEERTVSFLNGKFGLKPHNFPTLGSPDSDYVVAYMFDYTCPHCRTLHGILDQTLHRYGKQLAVVTLPMPLDANCNELVHQTKKRHIGACDLAKISMAVWLTDRAKFETFHKWMMHGEKPPDVDATRAKAEEIIGKEPLDEALAMPWISEQIARNIELYKLTGEGSIPKLFVRHVFVSGRPGEAEDLFELFEEELDIKPLPGFVPLVESKEE